MFRARLQTGAFVLGLDAENVRRLKAGEPIVLSLAQLGGTDDIVIMYGDTYDEIKNTLEVASGRPLPEPIPLPEPH